MSLVINTNELADIEAMEVNGEKLIDDAFAANCPGITGIFVAPVKAAIDAALRAFAQELNTKIAAHAASQGAVK